MQLCVLAKLHLISDQESKFKFKVLEPRKFQRWHSLVSSGSDQQKSRLVSSFFQSSSDFMYLQNMFVKHGIYKTYNMYVVTLEGGY